MGENFFPAGELPLKAVILNLPTSNPINAFPHLQIMMTMIFVMKKNDIENDISFSSCCAHCVCGLKLFFKPNSVRLSICIYSNLRGNFPNDYLPTIRFWESFPCGRFSTRSYGAKRQKYMIGKFG